MFEIPANAYYENDMNIYPNMLTPPTEDSSYAEMTSSTYDEMINHFQMDQDSPYLKIIEQPVDKFRFRYKSEMAGTHGSLSGMASEKNRRATFPTVELSNFSGKAVVRCSLYQYNTIDELKKPHAHRLIKKYGNEERDDPHDLAVSKDNGYQAIFHSMGIIHTAKKNIEEELIKKKSFQKIQEVAQHRNATRNLTKEEKNKIREEAIEEAKSLNLNKVCLRFEALIENNKNGILVPLCAPIYSHAINNLKSALTGELKIVRMDHCTSPCKGGREIYILVEKVTKKNIKIRFCEVDEHENEIWHDYGKFNDLDVHHQYAIVFKTPAYKETNLEQTKKVYIELERPSDGARSEKKEFYYTPCYNVGSKRPRTCNSSSSSYSYSSSNLPVVLTRSDSKELDDINIEKFFNSKEIQEVLLNDEIASLFNDDLRMDAPNMNNEAESIIKPTGIIDTQKLVMEFNELRAFLQTNPSLDRCKKRMETIYDHNFLHNAIMANHRGLVLLISILAKICGEDSLNMTNSEGLTGLHLAVIHNNFSLVTDLLKYGAIADVQDDHGNTPLHLAIKEELSMKIIHTLITVSKNVDLENSEKQTALHLAVQNDMPKIVEALCRKGADVNITCKNSGRNVLHMAIEIGSLEIVTFLLEHTEIYSTIKDYKGINCLEMALALTNDKPIRQEIHKTISTYLLSKNLLRDCDIKAECVSEDEDEATSIPTSVPEVKKEILSVDIKNLYKNVTIIPKEYLNRIVTILNRSGSWMDLANLLDLDYLMHSNVIDKENPAQNLLNVALAKGENVLDIRNFLEHLEEAQAVRILDDMAEEMKVG